MAESPMLFKLRDRSLRGNDAGLLHLTLGKNNAGGEHLLHPSLVKKSFRLIEGIALAALR
jgi:hypothetical protein